VAKVKNCKVHYIRINQANYVRLIYSCRSVNRFHQEVWHAGLQLSTYSRCYLCDFG